MELELSLVWTACQFIRFGFENANYQPRSVKNAVLFLPFETHECRSGLGEKVKQVVQALNTPENAFNAGLSPPAQGTHAALATVALNWLPNVLRHDHH